MHFWLSACKGFVIWISTKKRLWNSCVQPSVYWCEYSPALQSVSLQDTSLWQAESVFQFATTISDPLYKALGHEYQFYLHYVWRHPASAETLAVTFLFSVHSFPVGLRLTTIFMKTTKLTFKLCATICQFVWLVWECDKCGICFLSHCLRLKYKYFYNNPT